MAAIRYDFVLADLRVLLCVFSWQQLSKKPSSRVWACAIGARPTIDGPVVGAIFPDRPVRWADSAGILGLLPAHRRGHRGHRRRGGSIRIAGTAVSYRGPQEARHHGIETVYQDLALVDDLAVYQNVFLDRELTWGFGPVRFLAACRGLSSRRGTDSPQRRRAREEE
jgi:hypothetical protein